MTRSSLLIAPRVTGISCATLWRASRSSQKAIALTWWMPSSSFTDVRRSGEPGGERRGRLSRFRGWYVGGCTDIDDGDDALAFRHTGGGARGGVAHHRARLDVGAESELHRGERKVLHGHHRRGVVFLALLGVLRLDHGDGDHRGQRAVLVRDVLAHGVRG